MFFKKGTGEEEMELLEDEEGIEALEPVETKKKRRFSVITKKNLIVLSSLALIGGAVALNWYLFADGAGGVTDPDGGVFYQSEQEGEGGQYVAEEDSGSGTDSYFASTQISRQRARDEAIEVLQLVAENGEAGEDVKARAMADISAIAADIEKEANIETMITSKGFEQCVAVLGDEMVSIIVKTGGEGLGQNEITQIKEIVCEQTGFSPVDIKIIERAGS